MIKKFYTKFFLFLLVLGCATTTEAEKFPEWIENPHSLYPERLYLTAVGSGSSLEEAKKSALTSLSSIFSVNVKLDRKILEAYTEKEKKEEMNWEHSVNLVDRSILTSENRLINVRTAKTYFDEETGTFYVLSIISKSETEILYLEEIKKNDESLMRFYQEANLAENKITKFIYLKKCEQIAKIGEALRSIHRVLSLMEDTPQPPVSKEKIEVELHKLKSKIIVRIESSGKQSEELSSYLREVVQKTGLSIGRENPDIVMKGKLDITPLNLPRKGKFVRWELVVDVMNTINNTTMKTYTSSGREGHITHESVRGRALERVKEELKSKFYEEFNGFLSESYK